VMHDGLSLYVSAVCLCCLLFQRMGPAFYKATRGSQSPQLIVVLCFKHACLPASLCTHSPTPNHTQAHTFTHSSAGCSQHPPTAPSPIPSHTLPLLFFLCVPPSPPVSPQHLWTGPISNAPVEIIQGGRSVEVRPVGVTKGLAMQRILGYMASICGTEVSEREWWCVGWWCVCVCVWGGGSSVDRGANRGVR